MSQNHSSNLTREVPRIHIVGRKNAGKTTLVCELVEELIRQGHRVATIKHTHHHHELDTPGKDSHKHREAGAAGVGILSPEMSAAFVPAPRSDSDGYARFNVMFSDSDLIIVEGDLHTDAPRIEVWRDVVSDAPYVTTDDRIAALVTSCSVDVDCEVWSRDNIQVLAENVLRTVRG